MVRQNIEGIFGLWAMFAKQPPLALSPQEADMETKAFCDLLDAKKINITSIGNGAGLYFTLIISTFIIMQPRVVFMRSLRSARVSVAAAEPQEAAFAMGAKPMDFSSDVQGNA